MQTLRPYHRAAALALTAALSPAYAADAPQAGNQYNPRISLILNSTYADFSSKAPAAVPGFLLGDSAGFTRSGISLGETELAAEANIDDVVHGWVTLSLAPEGGVGVEEAFVNTLALPYGFAAKLGRFFSDIGYQNHQHAHAWEFADAPLVYRAMLNNQLGDDGLQVRWLAPTDLLVELGGEVLRGDAFPAGGANRSGATNSIAAFVHVGGDAGTGGSWRVGLSHLKANADNRLTGDKIQTSFTGNSGLSILDLVYKWAPDGNPSVTNFVGQAEFFYRKEDGNVVYDPSGTPNTSAYQGNQEGFYLQGVYQFMPRWRAGLRYDQLSANNTVTNPVPGTALETLADNTRDPRRYSVMSDFSNSEFSRVRLQYNHDLSRPNGVADNQLLVQFIFSMGSHPAHQF